MGWYKAWKRKQLEDRIFRLVIGEIANQLAAGVPLEDIWKPCVVDPVEWDTEGQFWKARYASELKEGRLIQLLSGRGGAEEYARIVRVLDDVEWYEISFDGMDVEIETEGVYTND
jgi:hypothetical protein